VLIPIVWPGAAHFLGAPAPPAGGGGSAPPFGGWGNGPDPSVYVNATVSMGSYFGYHPANPFFAVVFTAAGHPTSELVTLGAYLNTTPITWFRFGGEGEGYDPTTQLSYLPPSSPGVYRIGHGESMNFTWAKSWCYARTPHCSWLGYLPGEENDTLQALHTAEWFHDVLDFAPPLWQFDNEPDHWLHYGLNRTVWSTYDDATPTASDVATMVRDYIAAVAPEYPADRYVGIEAGCACYGDEIAATVALNGPHLAAMAYHNYPGIDGSATSVDRFYGGLLSVRNTTTQTGFFRDTVTSACPSCDIALQVGEYQTGAPVDHSPFALEYPGAPWMAASVIEALQSNLSMFTVFDTTWLVNATTGSVLPEGLLYQRILANLTMGSDYNAPIYAPGVGGVFSVLIQNGSHRSLLVVNTNTTYGLNLSVPTSVLQVGSTGSEWIWSPSSTVPSWYRDIQLPTSYHIPEQSILLINNY